MQTERAISRSAAVTHFYTSLGQKAGMGFRSFAPVALHVEVSSARRLGRGRHLCVVKSRPHSGVIHYPAINPQANDQWYFVKIPRDFLYISGNRWRGRPRWFYNPDSKELSSMKNLDHEEGPVALCFNYSRNPPAGRARENAS
jgi:hypothetical protein